MLKSEELLRRIEKNIQYRKPYGFMVGEEKEFYEAELDCLMLARRNIAIQPVMDRCPVCKYQVASGSNFCSNCGQKLKEN